MNKIRQILLTTLLLAYIITLLDVPALSNNTVAQAATLKMSTTKLVLAVGQTKTLSVTGSTKKATWSSSKKSVATVSSKGKVTSVAVGTAKVTAKIGDKKFYCTVTVTKSNPHLTNAPFKAEETKIDDISFIIPSGWKVFNQNLADDYIYTEITPPSSSKINSILRIDIRRQDSTPTDYDQFKAAFSGDYTADLLTLEWERTFGKTKFNISDIEQSDFEAPFNKVLKTQCTVKADGTIITQTIYDFFIGEYLITFRAEDYDKTDLVTMADYIVSSFMTTLEIENFDISANNLKLN